ncbi:flavin reductase family protein [Agromyces intestinalis]|uniref:Flavin reductase family protein n=1 Tax=Agromyces intestinalis TaxID=2592652 RepID=A0A5C1YMB2_9MICO|nr:flavin reductase family protein [Agromyces intestinalis]
MTAEQFTGLFRHHPGGVAVITADAGDGPVGLTATSVASVSVAPPLLVFSASERSSSTPTLLSAATAVVHLLGADDLGIAELCATSGVDRFADRSLWSRLPSGEPVFHVVGSWIRVRVEERVRAGTATLVVGRAIETSPVRPEAAPPLVYHARGWHGLGDHSRLAS